MDKGLKNNKGLIAILVTLVLVIIGLAVTIVSINIMNNTTPGVEDCSKIEDSYEQSVCLANIYEGEEDEAIKDASLNKVLDKAFEERNYQLFVDTLLNQAGWLAIDQRCDEAMKVLDDERITKITADERAYFYSSAEGVALECNDEVKRQGFSDKYWELSDSGELETPVFDEGVEPIRDDEEEGGEE